ncbi:MAG: hypothetical protein KGH78_04485 [Candidatus Micrarchaeota archaeon]|nr:hypothetical protein [Candidatus Micrarchaeota archaeon]
MGSGPAIRSSVKGVFTIKLLCRDKEDIPYVEAAIGRSKGEVEILGIRQLDEVRRKKEPYDLEFDVSCSASEAIKVSDQVRKSVGSDIIRNVEIHSPPVETPKWRHYMLEFSCLEDAIPEAKGVLEGAGFQKVKVLGPSNPMALGVLWHTNFTRERADEWLHGFYIAHKDILISAGIRDAGILDRLVFRG